MRASPDSELVVRYQTLDDASDPYYIEITPSFVPGRRSDVPSSYLVVSGKSSGGTSYHNRFILVPQRLYIEKTQGGPTDLLLRKGPNDGVSVVEVR